MPTKLNPMLINGEQFYYGFSFDIDDFMGDGIWWLQIYDNGSSPIYDKPFTSSVSRLNEEKI